MARVVLEKVAKTFRSLKRDEIHAVRHVSLTVEDGEFVVLVGPSGSGKSTLLRMIAGLEDVSAGTISIDGRVVNDVAPQDRDIAMVFQNHALYPHMTVFENIAFGLKLRKVPKPEMSRRVDETAEILGLDRELNRFPSELSGGQKQRVAVGRAIVRNPRVFLFDEPLSNLDAVLRTQMRMELSKLYKRLGTTMIYVTHDQLEAMSLGNRIAVINDGSIQQVAEPMTLYDRPANLFVAAFIGSPPMNLFKGVLVNRGGGTWFEEQGGGTGSICEPLSLRLCGHPQSRVDQHIGMDVLLGLRPEDIGDETSCARVENDSGESSAGQSIVQFLERLGSETHLHLRAGGAPFVARLRPEYRANIDDEVTLRFNMRRAHFFDPLTEERIAL